MCIIETLCTGRGFAEPSKMTAVYTKSRAKAVMCDQNEELREVGHLRKQ